MSKRLAWLCAPALLLISSVASAAPTKSFTAATANLPADTEVLGSSNVKAVRSTQVYQKLLPDLLKLEKEVPELLDKVKKTCSIDMLTSIDDLTVGMNAKESGAFFLAVNGVTEQKMLECLTKIGKQEGESVTSKKTGNITEVKGDKSKKGLFYAWLPGDVLTIAFEPDDKSMLENALSGKGALTTKSKMSGRIARANPENAVTVIWTKERTIEKKTVKNGEFTIAAQGGNLNIAANAEMGSSKEAEDVAKLAKEAQQSLPLPKDAPKELEKILKSLQVSASGAEVRATLSVSERDVVSVIQAAAKRKSSR